MNNWDDVKFFLQVARDGNVTKAARQLGVNHSTVSRRIQALEERHGVRLFERVPSGYELTLDAQEIYEVACQIEAQHLAFSRKLQGQDSRLAGRVTLTMPHDLFDFFFAPRLAKFQQQYPDIVIDLHVAKGLKNLSAREADIAVRNTPNPPEYLVGTQVCPLTYRLYQKTESKLPEAKPTTNNIIVWQGESTPPEWAQQNIEKPKIVLQVDELTSMYQAVKAGIGIARMPVFMHNLSKDAGVTELDFPLAKSDWGIWVLNHQDLRNTKRVQVLKKFLLNELKQNKNLFQNGPLKSQ